jgi:hypothetical protein
MRFPTRIEAKGEVRMGKPGVKGTREGLLACLEYVAALAAEEVSAPEA